MQPSGQQHLSVSMKEYAAALQRNGQRVVPGANETYWIAYESHALMRMPTCCIDPPSPEELRRLFRHDQALLLSYLIEPNNEHPANAWLYVCTNSQYCRKSLAPPVRRNINRGYAELRIAPLSVDDVLAHGFQAFRDTRSRVGLGDGTETIFQRRFSERANCSGHVFLGAWKSDKLAAFASITEVEDWAVIEGCFSADDALPLRPNDTLVFHALSYYLNERGCRLVSYGASSIQAESNRDSLHRFKIKMGFEAQPVHRAFVFHPFLRPFVNRISFWGVNTLLRLNPRIRRLKKLGGVLSLALSQKRFIGKTGNPISDSIDR